MINKCSFTTTSANTWRNTLNCNGGISKVISDKQKSFVLKPNLKALCVVLFLKVSQSNEQTEIIHVLWQKCVWGSSKLKAFDSITLLFSLFAVLTIFWPSLLFFSYITASTNKNRSCSNRFNLSPGIRASKKKLVLKSEGLGPRCSLPIRRSQPALSARISSPRDKLQPVTALAPWQPTYVRGSERRLALRSCLRVGSVCPSMQSSRLPGNEMWPRHLLV